MSLPSERTMPIVVAEWHPGYGYVMVLPGGRERIAVDEKEVRLIVSRELPGTAIRFVRGREGVPAT